MKRTFKNLALILMLVVAFAFVAMQASAADASVLTFANCEGGVMVSDCKDDASGELEIPAEYNGKKVVKIGDNAFDGCTKLTKVVLPADITVIGSSAFEGCSTLAAINFPEGLKTISEYAFFGCDAIKEVVLYPNVTTIGAYAFYECAGLVSVNIPKNITAINDGVFGQCASLAKIYIPEGVKSIGDEAFDGCPNLKEVYYCKTLYLWETIEFGANNDDVRKSSEKFGHAHDYAKAVSKEPDCTKSGAATFYCVCGDIYNGEVAALGHSAITVEAVKPTCTETGKTESQKCSRCGLALTETSIIPATGHKKVTDQAKEATCTATGLTSGSHCDFCGEVFEKQEVIEMIGHEFDYESLEKASTTTNGKRKGTCRICGYQADEVLYNVSVFKLSTEVCTYNGKERTPSVTVKNSEGKELIKDRDFTVTYASGRKNPGIYNIKVTLTGEYEGSKTLKFTIAPGKTSNIKAEATKTNAVKLTWKAVTGATGYRVYVYKNTKDKTRVKVASVTTNSYTLTKDYASKALVMGTSYKIAITAYTKDSKGNVTHAQNGVAFTFKFVPPTPTLKVATTAKGRVTLYWNDVAAETGYQVYYSTDGKSFTKLASYKGWPDKQYKEGLNSGRAYYFKVRAYTKVGSTTVYGAFSEVKSIKIK